MGIYSKTLDGFDNILRVLAKEDKGKAVFAKVAAGVFSSAPGDVVRHDYEAGGDSWTVWESPRWKITGNGRKTYNSFFSKVDGFTCKFGERAADDPEWCALGPEIADIEVVAGKCPKVNGGNCAFCYKGNGGGEARCMPLGKLDALLGAMPKCLTQVAFGITGYYTNPDFGEMLSCARRHGVVPNYTTNGADVDDAAVEKTLDECGRVAVSCYEGAKDLCYATTGKFGKAAERRGKKFPCNIHVVLSKATFPHVMSVLEDARDGRIPNLGAVVVLRMKPVGRAAALDCVVPPGMYGDIVDFCLGAKVPFGFDSCGAKRVAEVLLDRGRPDLVGCVEPCESTRMSVYVSQAGKITPCSFCEGLMADRAVDAFAFRRPEDFIAAWNGDPMLSGFRAAALSCGKSCQVYDLD